MDNLKYTDVDYYRNYEITKIMKNMIVPIIMSGKTSTILLNCIWMRYLNYVECILDFFTLLVFYTAFQLIT